MKWRHFPFVIGWLLFAENGATLGSFPGRLLKNLFSGVAAALRAAVFFENPYPRASQRRGYNTTPCSFSRRYSV